MRFQNILSYRIQSTYLVLSHNFKNLKEYVICNNQFPHPITDKPLDLEKGKEKVKMLPHDSPLSQDPPLELNPVQNWGSRGQERKSGWVWKIPEKRKPVPNFLCVTWENGRFSGIPAPSMVWEQCRWHGYMGIWHLYNLIKFLVSWALQEYPREP